MKKFLCVVLALTTVCCFASCKDNKCDDCGTTENVKVYEKKDGSEVEYCPSCYAKVVLNGFAGSLLG